MGKSWKNNGTEEIGLVTPSRVLNVIFSSWTSGPHETEAGQNGLKSRQGKKVTLLYNHKHN